MNKQKPLVTSAMVVNVMMGTGPLIIPCVFLTGGWALATIFILIMGALSTLCALFAMEALSIANAMKNSKDSRLISEITENIERIPINSRSLVSNGSKIFPIDEKEEENSHV